MLKATDRQEARRIEILSSKPYTERSIKLLYNFFLRLPPFGIYTLWVYDAVLEGIKQVGCFG